jgi:hypothetical protein
MTYNRRSVENALDIHTRTGLIARWVRDPDDSGPGHVITLCLGETVTTHSLRETMLVVQGLGSASHAITIPGKVGSPAMRVVSAIETGNGEYMCVVQQTSRPADEPHYGTITGYRASDGSWQATGGMYDFTDVAEANRNAAERAGIPVATRRLRRQRALAVLASRPYDKSQDQAERLLDRAERGLQDGRDHTWMCSGRAAVIAYRNGEDIRFDIRDRDPDQVPADHDI